MRKNTFKGFPLDRPYVHAATAGIHCTLAVDVASGLVRRDPCHGDEA